MGLAEIFLGKDNPFAQWAGQNQNFLGALGGGLAQGQNIQSGLSAGMAQVPQAKALDYQTQLQRTADAKVLAQENATKAWLEQNYPQYAHLPPEQGFRLAMSAEQQKYTGAGGSDLGLNPQYGVDANGNPVILQLGKDGRAVQTAMPDGVTLSKEPIKLDAGTHWVLLDPISRQPVGQVSKNNQEAAFESGYGTAAGKAAAERIESLPNVLAKADNMVDTIDGILNDPALDVSTGWLSWMQSVPGTDQYRFGQRALQLQGQAFLQAFESLKGAGQITEVEGAKATQAIGRLSTAQSAEDYRAALAELKSVIEASKQRAISRGGGAVGLPHTTPAPTAPVGNTTSTGVQWSVGP